MAKSQAKRNDTKHDAEQAELVCISGTIDRTFFSSPTWTAGKIAAKSDKPGLHSFTVKQQVSTGDRVSLYGRWTTHEKYGHQFTAELADYDDIPNDAYGLEQWLAKNKDISGVGPAKARRIAEEFGDNFDTVVTHEPERVGVVARLSASDLENLRNVWIANKENHGVMVWLAGLGLSIYEIRRVVDAFGAGAVGVLRADPYQLIHQLDGFGFRKVDAIAQKLGVPKNDIERIKHGIRWCLWESLQKAGNTFMYRDDLVHEANTALELDTLESEQIVNDMIAHMVRHGELWGDGQSAEAIVSTREMWEAEQFLAQWAKRLMSTNNNPTVRWSDDMAVGLSSLNYQQKNAAIGAIQHGVSVITGGAGTGKTYTISSVLNIYEQHGTDRESIILCAPTGKAARRMEETTSYPAQTIHRLLGWNGTDFSVDAVDASLVVVDECSMLDSMLAQALLSRIDTQKTSIVLVGDHHQLPPVGPGNSFRDIIQSQLLPVTTLTEVVRQAGTLKANSTAILDGNVPSTAAPDGRGFVSWQLLDDHTDAESCFSWVTRAFRAIVASNPSVDIVRDIQILTPTHERTIGTRALNIGLQAIYQEIKHGREIAPVPENRRPVFYPDDKVLQTRNNYRTGVMNGTLGRVTEIGSRGEVFVQFDGLDGLTEVAPDRRTDISLAYALTVHKCQGSEFIFVIMIVHKSHGFMHSRNLIYTGATRAKHKLIIVGDAWGIRNSVKEVERKRRKTILSRLLDA
jgi:exodeoxyribonuclease V alpha subunit